MFSIELVQASERLSFAGKPRRLTVSISSSPSRMLAATPGASWSSRRARLRNSRSAEGPGGATAGDDRKSEPMDPLSASQSTVCGLAWKRYSRQTPLRDVAPALNGRASLAAAMPNGRCKLHGGKSTGPRTMEGLERSRRANWKHGHFSREAKAERSRLRAAILALRDLCDST